jgi:hypothetical protein
MVWPPRSPNMNPIEHLWDVVERSIRTHKCQGAVGGYPDSMAQHLSRGLPSTCGIDATSSCCTLPG